MNNETIAELLAWYDQNKRSLPWRGPRNAYYTWVSEIMLQQTRVEAVKGYFVRFTAALPNVAALAQADDDRLMKLWEGLGYYARARNLKKAAQVVMRDYDGQLPADPAQLLKLPGIGLYTAGAIASIAYGVSVPAVDGNVLRVLARYKADNADIALEQTKKAVGARLLAQMPKDAPGQFNQALMEVGATVCLPNGAPRCDDCPLMHGCLAYAQGLTRQLPVKSKPKPRRTEHRSLYILRWEDKLALHRRAAKGLLAGMWELPEQFDLPPALVMNREDSGYSKIIFTHLEWHMAAERVRLREPLAGFAWVTKEELARDYALPSAFAGFAGALFG